MLKCVKKRGIMMNEEKVKNNGVRRKEGLLCEFNVDGRQMVHI